MDGAVVDTDTGRFRELGGPSPSPTVHNRTRRFGETRNRQLITIICLLLLFLSFCIIGDID